MRMMLQTNEEVDNEELLCFNVGGKKFFVLRRCLDRLPDSRLGLLVHLCLWTILFLALFFLVHERSSFKWKVRAHPSERLRYCDRILPGEVTEYYFDMWVKLSPHTLRLHFLSIVELMKLLLYPQCEALLTLVKPHCSYLQKLERLWRHFGRV